MSHMQVVFEEPGGVRRSVVAQWLKGWRNDPQCGFWTTHCVRKSLHEVDVLPFTKVGLPAWAPLMRRPLGECQHLQLPA